MIFNSAKEMYQYEIDKLKDEIEYLERHIRIDQDEVFIRIRDRLKIDLRSYEFTHKQLR